MFFQKGESSSIHHILAIDNQYIWKNLERFRRSKVILCFFSFLIIMVKLIK